MVWAHAGTDRQTDGRTDGHRSVTQTLLAVPVMWKALRSRGIPNVLTDLIAALHENTLAASRVWKNKSNKASEKVLFELKGKR